MKPAVRNKSNSSASRCGAARQGQSGFTVVELLIVLAILSSVMAAVFSIYNMQHRATHIEEDVVDVQQNLRMGMEKILKDLRMAALLIAGPVDPISSVSNDTGLNGTDVITLNTPSASGEFAILSASMSTSLVTSAPVNFTVSSAEEVDRFRNGDIVRIISPGEKGQPINTFFTVTGLDRITPSLTLMPGANGIDIFFSKGFVIAKTGDTAPDTYPNTISYCVGPVVGCGPGTTACQAGSCLFRVVNGTVTNDDIVASNIRDFQIKYILDGTSLEVDTPANLSFVRAARVTITGETVQTAQLSGAAKTRELTTVVKLRNR